MQFQLRYIQLSHRVKKGKLLFNLFLACQNFTSKPSKMYIQNYATLSEFVPLS